MPDNQRALLETALDQIAKETGVRTTVLDWEPRTGGTNLRLDAIIEIATPKNAQRFLAEVKPNIDRYETLLNLRNFAAHRGQAATLPFVVVTRFITQQIAEQCRKVDLYFIDTVGNAYFRTPDLHVYVTGKKRPKDLTLPAEEGRAMTPAGLQILFAFLCNPHFLNATYREIAQTARVALGTIGPVIRDLERRKHITPAAPDLPGVKRRMIDPERLLKEWVTAYPTTLRPKLNARRYRANEANWTAGVDLKPYHAYWGGEVAGARLTHYVAPQMATLYVQNPTTRLLLDLRLRADINGDVELLDVFWNPERLNGTGDDVVPPLLAYADLMATADGRNLEVAKMIYDEFIGPHLRNQA